MLAVPAVTVTLSPASNTRNISVRLKKLSPSIYLDPVIGKCVLAEESNHSNLAVLADAFAFPTFINLTIPLKLLGQVYTSVLLVLPGVAPAEIKVDSVMF